MTTIAQRIQVIKQRIAHLEQTSQRPSGSVQLLAVSKGQDVGAIKAAFAAGVHDFGENYWQEARNKIQALQDLPICWHFIGPIQRNKAKAISRHFTWVHSVADLKIAQLLNEARPDSMPPIQTCLQVNLEIEGTKSGATEDELISLVHNINQLPRLHLRGLMLIPSPCDNEQQQYQIFLRLAQWLQQLNQTLHLNLDTLSMGMSDDLQAAIRAGSTLVRIGRAIFGERTL